MNISIIGTGSWGVALAIHLADRGNNIKMWSYSEEEKNMINNEHRIINLPEVTIQENVIATNSFEEAIEGSEVILNVTPSKVTKDVLYQYKNFVTNQVVVICTKGFEPESGRTFDEVFEEALPNTKIAVLSGPSHAEEVSKHIPTAVVIASKDNSTALMLQELFMNENMRIYTSNDVRGIELGGALKNIIAFCAGVGAGMGLGDNSFAALITRGLSEISRLGEILGGEHDTFFGLTGLGDLIVTCLSEHSRNRRAGKLIGQGKTLEEARQEIGMVIEGVDNIEVAYKIVHDKNVDCPIIDAVYNVLHNGLDVQEAVNMLMTRNPKAED